MSATIFQGPDGDWQLDAKKRLQIERDQLIVAGIKLRNRLKFFLGTWFLDLTQGFPYYQFVFVKSPDLNFITRLYTRVILSISPVITTMKAIDVRLDKKTRKLSVFFQAVAQDGRILSSDDDNVFRVDGENI